MLKEIVLAKAQVQDSSAMAMIKAYIALQEGAVKDAEAYTSQGIQIALLK